MKKRVLVLCTGNSCRSQMAEALFANEGWEAASAGSRPSGYVHPLAIEAMKELGIDISQNQSKNLSQFKDEAFDLVVTVCDNAKEACPIFPNVGTTLHWPFDDPAESTEIAMFRRVRDQIQSRIRSYLQGNE